MADGDTSTPSLLAGQSAPLFTITPTDQAGTIVVVAGVCIVTAVVSALIRLYIVAQVSRVRMNWDDWITILALIFGIIQNALVIREAHLGLGRTIQEVSSDQARSIQRTEFVDQIFYVLAVWTSKISVALFFLRLTPQRSNRRIVLLIITVVALSAIASICMLSIVCNLSHPWQYFTLEGVTCTSPYRRWIGTAVIDIVTEVALAGAAMKIISSLQIKLWIKLGVSFAFLQRLALIAPIITHLYYLSRVYKSHDPTLRAAFSTICKQVEVSFAIVAASAPCLKPFLTATATHYGAPAEGPKSRHGIYAISAGSQKERSKQSFKLGNLNFSDLSKKSKSQQSSSNNGTAQAEFSDSQYQSYTSGSGNEIQPIDTRQSMASDDSKGMIIRKDVDFTVHREDTSHEAIPSYSMST